MYGYNGTRPRASFTATGEGDLNGDDNTPPSLKGEINSGVVFVSPNIAELNPEE